MDSGTRSHVGRTRVTAAAIAGQRLRLEVGPASQPRLSPLADGQARALRVHVAAPHQCHGLLIEPPLRVDLAVEGLGDLAAGRVAEVRPVPLARPQRPLWASTSTKDPAYPDTRYVVDLVAPGVVNTMPEATLRAVADHGVVPMDSVRDQYDESQEVLDRLAALGIDYDDVVTTLEDDGWPGLTPHGPTSPTSSPGSSVEPSPARRRPRAVGDHRRPCPEADPARAVPACRARTPHRSRHAGRLESRPLARPCR